MNENILKAIAVTAELTGTELSEDAARVMAEDLSEYPEYQIMAALTRCRRELKTRLTVADVVSRVDDGRPGHEEAWAMIPKDEYGSVVWTSEMAEAYGIAAPMIHDGDLIQARMAFIEVYKSRCEFSRINKNQVQWIPSLGFDKEMREQALVAAVEKGRITQKHMLMLLPPKIDDSVLMIENKSSQLTSIQDKLKDLKLLIK